MSERSWPLGPRAARVFYNVADAWLDDDDASCCDAVAELEPALGEACVRRRLERRLLLLEWSPRLLLCSRRRFSWLSRTERRAWLEWLAAKGPRGAGRAIEELRRLSKASRAARGYSRPDGA